MKLPPLLSWTCLGETFDWIPLGNLSVGSKGFPSCEPYARFAGMGPAFFDLRCFPVVSRAAKSAALICYFGLKIQTEVSDRFAIQRRWFTREPLPTGAGVE